MVRKTRYSVRAPTHMSQPRMIWAWVRKLGSVKATASPCNRGVKDGMIVHTEGAPDVLGGVIDTLIPSRYRGSLRLNTTQNLRKFRHDVGKVSRGFFTVFGRVAPESASELRSLACGSRPAARRSGWPRPSGPDGLRGLTAVGGRKPGESGPPEPEI